MTGPGLGKGGTGTLKADGKVFDSHSMPRSLPIGVGWVETYNVGVYQVPFRFTGSIGKPTVNLGPEDLTPAEREMICGTLRAKQ